MYCSLVYVLQSSVYFFNLSANLQIFECLYAQYYRCTCIFFKNVHLNHSKNLNQQMKKCLRNNIIVLILMDHYYYCELNV